jgi:hypothetical protein
MLVLNDKTNILTESEKHELMLELEELAQFEGLRNYAQLGTELGISAETQTLIDSKSDETEVLKNDGSVALTDDWDVGDGKVIKIDKVMARDADGLILCEDSGNGIFVKDGGNIGIGTIVPSAKLAINGGLHIGGDSDPGDDNLSVDGNITTGIRKVTTTTLMTSTDSTLLCDSTSSAFTVTLPANKAGLKVIIKKIDSSSNVVTITLISGTIDGASYYLLEYENEFVILQCDGTNWYVIGE